MRQDRKTKLAKAQARTQKWRASRSEKKIPEARQIDRAIASGIVHMVVADRNREKLLPPELLPSLATVAAFILEQGYDFENAHATVLDRLEAFEETNEVVRARQRQTSA